MKSIIAALPMALMSSLALAVDDYATKTAAQTDIGPIALLFLVIIAGIGIFFWRMKRAMDKENEAQAKK